MALHAESASQEARCCRENFEGEQLKAKGASLLQQAVATSSRFKNARSSSLKCAFARKKSVEYKVCLCCGIALGGLDIGRHPRVYPTDLLSRRPREGEHYKACFG